MKYVYQYICTFLVFNTILFSCGFKTSEKIDANNVNRQIKERKIKQIKENDIIEQGYSIGQSIINTQLLKGDCGDLDKTILPDSLQSFVTKVWVDCSNPSDKIRKSMWEAYQYNIQNDLPLNDNIQNIITDTNRKSYLYSSPISVNDSLKVIQIELNHKALVLSLY